MRRTVLGVVLATLAMYMWGFLYWGANPLPYRSWKKSPDDVAAGAALLANFPESGTYFVPAISHDPKTLEALFRKGPVGFVHINREGRSHVDSSIMLAGFAQMAVTVSLLAALLSMAAPALGTYGARFRFILLAGLTAAIMADVGDAVWWQIPWAWKFHQAVYTITAWTVAGLVLAKFIQGGQMSRPQPA